ncbi:MAG: glycosyltransferase family 39 protein [Chloroflexi bacterium]|nr:glycosyltransferase family 39 protein [Chloroflexota bacterium]MCL5074822.1 glycosyltransferase family 39 protein [Chloroflexota bacterium]
MVSRSRNGLRCGLRASRNSLLVCLLLLLALFLRLFRLDFQSLRGDESFSVLFSAQSLGQITGALLSGEPHPPLYYFALHFWMELAGNSEFAVRFLSVFFDVLAVPLLYSLGRALLGERVGLVAAGILAINPFHLWNAQDARMYTAYSTLGLAATVVCVRALGWGMPSATAHLPRWTLLASYVGLATLVLYTHYYAVLVILFHNLLALLRLRRDLPALSLWLAAQGAIAIFYLPWLVASVPVIWSYGGTGDSPEFISMLQRLLSVFSLGRMAEEGLATGFAWGFGLLFVIGFWRAAMGRAPSLAAAALYLAVPILGVFLASRLKPVFNETYLLVATPAYYLILGCALAGGLRSRAWPFVGLAFVAVASGISVHNLFYDEAFAKSPDWRSAAEYLVSHFQEGDAIILNYPDPSLVYYWKTHGREGDITVLPSRWPVDELATDEELVTLIGGRKRVWLVPVRTLSWDAGGLVEGWLDHRILKVGEAAFRGLRLDLYETPVSLLSHSQHPLWIVLGGQVILRGFDIGQGAHGLAAGEELAISPGEPIPLTIYWQAVQRMEDDYKVFTHLEDGSGRIWAQKDAVPVDWAYPTRRWHPGEVVMDRYIIPTWPDTPAGEYELKVGMYDPISGQRLPLLDSKGSPTADSITLVIVNVRR